MIDMLLKYDNIHKNRMFYAFICINSHIITNINCMLSLILFFGKLGINNHKLKV